MKAEVYKAAVNGDVNIIYGDDATESELQSVTSGNNILHIAAQHGQSNFIEEALMKMKMKLSKTKLINQKNMNGDTPFHVAVRHGQEAVVHLLAANSSLKWLMAQNEDGDTPLHVALKYCHVTMARRLSPNHQILSVINHSQETPLHLFIRCLPLSVNGGMQGATSSGQIGKLNSEGVSILPKSVYLIFVDELEIVLRHFLSLYNEAACLRDAEGLTPLLRAARFGVFWALKIILELCPESVNVYDPKNRTVLHYVHFPDYKELQDLLKIPEINALKNVKDCEGNTPAHLAAKSKSLLLLKGLHESMADFSLKNNDNLTVDELIGSHEVFFSKMEEAIFNSRISGKWMEKELYEAAAGKGDVTLFDKKDATTDIDGKVIRNNDEYFLSRTLNGSTILHLAIQNCHSALVEEILKHFPTLLVSRDFNGDTPIHIAARLRAPAAGLMVHSCAECYHVLERTESNNVIYFPPWRTKNSKGNNAIHEAMRTSNYNVVEELFNVDPHLSIATNNDEETPLHVLARYATYTAEDKLLIIGRMLDLDVFPSYKKDVEGLTPAMRAAQSGRIRIALLIFQVCPQSMEVRDSKGRTFLHHLNLMHLDLVDESEDTSRLAEDFLAIPGVHSLRTAQDEDGNTPLHFALKTDNLVTAKFLMQSCLKSTTREELTIINKDGCSIFSLLALLQAKKPDNKDIHALALLNKKYVKEITLIEKIMEKELHMAAVQGDVKLFKEVKDDIEMGVGKYDTSYFLARTPDGSNIIHIALRPGKVDTAAFVEEALKQVPALLLQTDSNGDTPLHLAAKWYTPASIKLLEHTSECYQKAREESSRGVFLQPWSVKNSKGNMAIHEAMCTGHIYAASILVTDPEGALYVNDAGETALHVFARCGRYTAIDKLDFLETLISKNISAVYMRDNDGLTPLLRSAKCGRIRVAQAILEQCPQSAQLRDPNGRTFLHLLRLDFEFSEASSDLIFKFISKPLFEIPEVDALRMVQDYDGNSPLHYAIKTGNSITAKILAHKCFKTKEMFELALVNNENEGLLELIASYQTPDEIVKLLRKKVPKVNTSWFLSSYGIRKTDIKESAGYLSVIAALLTTMTFAAALQVPGGFDGDDGSPVLITRAAFKVFLVSDIVAMCSSMVVLFSLLWVMASGKTIDSFILLDLSFFLLQSSFYATLVAFMSGVYASTIHNSSWLAIFACALCSTVILITWKTSVLFLAKAIKTVTRLLFNLKTNSFKELYQTGQVILGGD